MDNSNMVYTLSNAGLILNEEQMLVYAKYVDRYDVWDQSGFNTENFVILIEDILDGLK